ncbi:MAG: HAMP domain-containing sensor histidine kinase [Cyclobacteriaceae bacterium]
MKNKNLRGVILFGTAVLTGLFLVQVYWFRKAFDVAEKQFDHSVQIALMRVADSVAPNAEVKKLSSNFFFVATESNLDNQAVDTLLKKELLRGSLALDYELGIYNADDDTLVYGQYVEATKKQFIEKEFHDKITSGREKNFAVYFPRKESYVMAQLNIWMFSTIVLLLMMGFFAYAIFILLRERKFAELKNDFINNMTHEFKTPVTNIGITGEIIRKKIPEAAGVNVYLDILLKENEKLRQKIDQVLLGSSVDHLARPCLERVDVHQLITECADAFQLKVQERLGKIYLDFHAKSTFILADRDLLTQAINNVIDNAEKYSPGKPCIVVKTRDQRNGIEIDIVDAGIGIPERMRGKVFQKFFRVQQGDVHNVKGFGLGLNFVKNVIRSHQGKVSLFSELQKGTEVRIFLPRA